MTSERTPDRQTFFTHVLALRDACDRVQPFADLPGNFAAIGALVNLDKAAKTIREDIDMLWSRPDQATCLHELMDLPQSDRPYRYQCRLCGRRLKIASGVKVQP